MEQGVDLLQGPGLIQHQTTIKQIRLEIHHSGVMQHLGEGLRAMNPMLVAQRLKRCIGQQSMLAPRLGTVRIDAAPSLQLPPNGETVRAHCGHTVALAQIHNRNLQGLLQTGPSMVVPGAVSQGADKTPIRFQ